MPKLYYSVFNTYTYSRIAESVNNSNYSIHTDRVQVLYNINIYDSKRENKIYYNIQHTRNTSNIYRVIFYLIREWNVEYTYLLRQSF